MSFYDVVRTYRRFEFNAFFQDVAGVRVEAALARDALSFEDFMVLLSPAAAPYLEQMAQRAHRLTVQHFGRTIQLYIPLYISNYCSNECIYCGFHRNNSISRRKLSLAEIELEARAIAATGMRHILFLTGEAPSVTPMDYLVETVRILKKHFASVAIEIYPMSIEDYRELRDAGADALTLYQEVYDEKRYGEVHLAGKKTDYLFRLDAPERGAKAGLRQVNLGPLLGLGEPRSEVFFLGMHAKYIENFYPHTEVGISLPRMNPAEGDFSPDFEIDDRMFVQFLTALRCFLPRSGITISTRESATFRDNLMPLGVTRFSAGSRTGVGGYCDDKPDKAPQFEITDTRSISDVVSAIRNAGYQPVYKDWDRI